MLSDDYLGLYATGYGDKAEHVAQLADGPTVLDFRLSRARLTPLADGLALLTYHAEYRRAPSGEDPERMWVSSIWRYRDGAWENLFSQDTAEDAVRPV